jgi:CBS domain-containing protein
MGALGHAGRVKTAVAVVDDGERLLGLIEPGTLASAEQMAGELRRDRPSIGESMSLADAVQRMARTHTRYLPVIDDRERVVGVLADLDALRWVARRRHSR